MAIAIAIGSITYILYILYTWRRFKMYCTFNNVHVQDKIADLIEDCVSQKEEKVASEENTQHRGNIRSLPN